MNSLYKLNINSFSRKRTFHNYIIINILLFVFIISTLTIKSYFQSQISIIMNTESNKEINISEYNSKQDLINFFQKYDSKILQVNYNIIVYEYEINNNIYTIYSDSTLDNSDLLISMPKSKKVTKLSIEDLTITHINFNNTDDVIYVNNQVSEYIFSNLNPDETNISFIAKDYLDINFLIDILESYNIKCHVNDDKSLTLNTYQSFYLIINIFFLLLLVAILLITIFINFNFLKEQKTNIKIYHNIGYSLRKIIYIYLFIFGYYIFVSFLISLILFIIILSILLLIDLNLFKFILNNIVFSIIFMNFMNLIIVIIEVLLIIKKDK